MIDDDDYPSSVLALIRRGGVEKLARDAAAREAADVIRRKRQFWLQVLETWRDDPEHAEAREDLTLGSYLESEITRLRRTLGISSSPERRRAQTRDRVRRWRENRARLSCESLRAADQ